jgi:hypothetical protein
VYHGHTTNVNLVPVFIREIHILTVSVNLVWTIGSPQNLNRLDVKNIITSPAQKTQLGHPVHPYTMSLVPRAMAQIQMSNLLENEV